MQFKNAMDVDSICYQMRLADYPRGVNRARIDELFNGVPPYNEEEEQANNININVNSLEGTRIAHDARSQFYGAFLKPGNFFKVATDMGPAHKRSNRGVSFTKHVNRKMKKSLWYFEKFRSTFATDVLHGVGPGAWENRETWCPDPIAMEDILVPANTLLTMKNLPFFAVYRSYTAPELIRQTSGPRVDRGWNMPLVKACLEWIDKETVQLIGSNWPEVWSPEKAQERVKGDGGYYMGDQVPTIDTYDFYYLDLDSDNPGWKRRIILDSWSTPQTYGQVGTNTPVKRSGKPWDKQFKDGFLFNPGDRVYANRREELVSFQFADLSAVAPFRYHSVRSLGFLLYSVCHLQNRLRCKFNESVFEALMMYFRVKTMEDAERALKLDLVNRGFIDETLQFIPANERFQVNASLVQLGLTQNSQLINENSASYTQNQNFSEDRVQKTKFQVMAEANAVTSLVSAGLLQAYFYQAAEYEEIKRRFCRRNSQDHDVREVQAACLRDGIPEKMLYEPECWHLEPEKVMGSGNKTLEMAIAQQLMEYRPLYDPEPQRDILRDVTLAITDDPARAMSLVPESPVKVSDSSHDAQLAAGTLMQDLPVAMKTGINHIEYVEAMIASMALVISKIKQSGALATPQQLTGLTNMVNHTQAHVQVIAGDKNEKERVAKYEKQISLVGNTIKQQSQQLQKQMMAQQAQNGNGGMDAKDRAKIMAIRETNAAKIQNTRESHAQRTAQRQLQFEQKMRQDAEQHRLDIAKTDLEAASNIRRNRALEE
jgi:hypothetical protein